MPEFNHSTPTTPRAAIYCRTATAGHDADPLADQEARCRGRCQERGYRVERVEHDLGSGLRLEGRPGLDALRAAIAAGTIDVVVATDPQRLSRDQADLSRLVLEAATAGVRLDLLDGRTTLLVALLPL